jgi:hypothetical protein
MRQDLVVGLLVPGGMCLLLLSCAPTPRRWRNDRYP